MHGPERDPSLDTLLDLHGQTMFVDHEGRFWVKFEVHRIEATPERPHGLKYSLTLHALDGERLLGFDNAHPVDERPPDATRVRPQASPAHDPALRVR